MTTRCYAHLVQPYARLHGGSGKVAFGGCRWQPVPRLRIWHTTKPSALWSTRVFFTAPDTREGVESLLKFENQEPSEVLI